MLNKEMRVHSSYGSLSTEVSVGVDEGLKHESSVHCDGLMSMPKAVLTDFVGRLKPEKVEELNRALEISIGLR
jgi:mRNA interferase MazF